jgi:hypothetical protein
MTNKEIIKFGEEEIIFYPDSHRYKKDKEWLLSVTAITGIVDKSRVLMNWVAKVAEETGDPWGFRKVQEDALSIGSEVHEWCEKYIQAIMLSENKPEVPQDEKVSNGVMAFLEWQSKNDIEYIESERLVYHRELNYVGRFDLLMRRKNEIILADFKTSKGYYPLEMGLQLVGYKMALENETEEKIDKLEVLRFDKETGDFEVHEIQKVEKLEEGFKACLFLRRLQKEIE